MGSSRSPAMKWSQIRPCASREAPAALLENEPWEPVGNSLRHRFSNRFPQTETIGVSLRPREFNPVP